MSDKTALASSAVFFCLPRLCNRQDAVDSYAFREFSLRRHDRRRREVYAVTVSAVAARGGRASAVQVTACIQAMARCVMASDTDSRLAARCCNIFYAATSCVLLGMPKLLLLKSNQPTHILRRITFRIMVAMSSMLSLRLSSEQEMRLTAIAARQGITRSEWLRNVIELQIAAAEAKVDSHAIYLELMAPLAAAPGSGRAQAARQHSKVLKQKLHARGHR